MSYLLQEYEAYVYLINIKTINKKYIGYHKGLESDPYIHSSTSEELKKDMNEYGYDIQIIQKGTCEQMAMLERKMLSKVDAKNNPNYYNKSNGGGKYVKTQILSNDIYKEFTKDKYKKTMTYDEFVNLEKYQIRFENTKPSHVNDLEEQIIDLKGDMSKWENVLLVFEGNKNSNDLLANGIHTQFACKRASRKIKITDLPVVSIPYKVHKEYNVNEKKEYINTLNPKNKKPKLEMSDEDAKQVILNRYYDKNIPVISDDNNDYLSKCGFSQRARNSLYKKVISEINNKEWIPNGHIIRDYVNDDVDRRFLNQLKIDDEKNGNYTISNSSANFHWTDFLVKHLPRILEKNIKTVIIRPYHTSVDNKQKWANTNSVDCSQNKLNAAIQNLNKAGVALNFYISPLEFTKINPLNGTK